MGGRLVPVSAVVSIDKGIPVSLVGAAIVLVHNRYQEPGGEDVAFEAEAELLEQHGHTVHRVTFDNRGIPDKRAIRESLRLASGAIWSKDSGARVAAAVRESRAGIVHFHNTFPLVSAAAYSYCRKEGAAIVQTLHNYRLFCPNALFFRSGRPCEDCLRWPLVLPGVVHRCYRGSRSQSGVVAAMLAFHRLRGTWHKDVDVFIALTEFSRRKFIEGGLPAERILTKPNFLEPAPDPAVRQGSQFLFAGRLSPAKGIDLLLEAWGHQPKPLLKIIGDGPWSSDAAALVRRMPNVVMDGRQPRENVLDELHHSIALVFPSKSYENFPLAVVEAFACGVPVIAARLGAIAEIIDDHRTGLLFRAGDAADLASKLAYAANHADQMFEMGKTARKEYETKFTGVRNYMQLMDIYRQARCRRNSPSN